MKSTPKLNDVVALLAEVPRSNLGRGQVGTVVEVLSVSNLLVEFSDDEGKAYAVTALPTNDLLVLHYEMEVA